MAVMLKPFSASLGSESICFLERRKPIKEDGRYCPGCIATKMIKTAASRSQIKQKES